MQFSIIIPVKEINDYIKETVTYIQNLTISTWELIVIPNNSEPNLWQQDKRITILPSGRVGPADKRDLGAKQSKGEILVFLDDDSYPESNLLEIATQYFQEQPLQNQNIVALGGPAVTPPQDGFWQRVSGAVFLSKLSGGAPERYIPIGEVREIDDWPSVNLMVRKQEFLSIGGFNSPYWPGEDTKLCLDLIQKTDKKILYIPQMQVWHHRRAGLPAHLKQVGAYGLHRGFFAKKYPETSRKLIYFAPSVLLMFLMTTVIVQLFFQNQQELNLILKIGWAIYGLALIKAFLDMNKYESITVSAIAIIYTFLTHLFYGAKFIQGLLTVKLVSTLR